MNLFVFILSLFFANALFANSLAEIPHEYLGAWTDEIQKTKNNGFKFHQNCEPGPSRMWIQKNKVVYGDGSGGIAYSLKVNEVKALKSYLIINGNMKLKFKDSKKQLLEITVKKQSSVYAKYPLNKNPSIKFSKDDCTNWKG